MTIGIEHPFVASPTLVAQPTDADVIVWRQQCVTCGGLQEDHRDQYISTPVGPMYAVIGLLGVNEHGQTDEVTHEAHDIDIAVALIRRLALSVPGFRAITLVHIEDFMPVMGGSEHMGEAHPTPSPDGSNGGSDG